MYGSGAAAACVSVTLSEGVRLCFSRNLCVTFSQGCNKVLWGVIGAAVVITLITIPAVYFSSKLQPPGLCMRFSPVCDHEQKDN